MAPPSVEKERPIFSVERGNSKPYVANYTVDTAAILVATEDITLTPEESWRLRRKIDLHILPLMFRGSISIPAARCARLSREPVLYWVQFMDKTTLGSSAILGIREDANLTTNEYVGTR